MRFKVARQLTSEIVEKVARKDLRSPSIEGSIGIAPSNVPRDFKVAIRVPELTEGASRLIAAVVREASGEVDIRVTGRIARELPPAIVEKRRTLTVGSSVAHYLCSAGTLGFFARRLTDGAIGFVSCNHVLAAEDKGHEGDDILSPAPADRGVRPRDVVGRLSTYARLHDTNPMDCAFATLSPQTAFDPMTIGPGEVLARHAVETSEAAFVQKIGRSTGRTRGRVTAFDLDFINVDYSFGKARLKRFVEIDSAAGERFSAAGDSGALVFADDFRPMGLLFASTTTGLAYAHPFDAVIERLGVQLLA